MATAGQARFPMHTLTVTATNLSGKPDTGDIIDVFNVNNLAAFGLGGEGENDFYQGSAKFSLPAGTYWAIGTFFTGSAQRLDVIPQFTVKQDTTLHVSA